MLLTQTSEAVTACSSPAVPIGSHVSSSQTLSNSLSWLFQLLTLKLY